MVGNEPVQHLGQRAAFFARQHGSDVDGRENALLGKRIRKQRSVLDVLPDRADVRTQLLVRQPVRQQIQALQNREAGADQGHELLVEDQEFLKVDLLAPLGPGDRNSGDFASRPDGIDQVALLGVLVADLFLSRALHHLLMDFSPRIGVLENEVRHYCPVSPLARVAPAGILNLNRLSSTRGFSFS